MKTKKLKLLNLLRFRSKKLRATAVRRPLRIPAAGYDEIAEPNMKLSRALLIVLLLHVVAVAGIIAFNAIKTRQGSFASGAAVPNPPAATQPITAVSAPVAKAVAAHEETKPARTAKSSPNDNKASFAGKSYVVAKGDNPVTIAKKFKVPYDDLLALNHIDDPRKLKIGQKLLIPSKSAKGKKDE